MKTETAKPKNRDMQLRRRLKKKRLAVFLGIILSVIAMLLAVWAFSETAAPDTGPKNTAIPAVQTDRL